MGVCPYFDGQYCKTGGELRSQSDYQKQTYCLSRQKCTECENFKAEVKRQNG